MDVVDIEVHSSDRRRSSPDIFASFEEDKGSQSKVVDEEMPLVAEVCQENRDSNPDWKGTPLEELPQSIKCSSPLLHPRVRVSTSHTVMFKIPLKLGEVPAPYLATPHDKWDQDHVRMPNSSESLYPVQETEDEKGLRLRWELVQEALLRNIVNSHQLESAILSFNSRYNEKWNFVALHSFFNHVLEENETECFFRDILPRMVNLALQLSELVTAPIPLLRKHRTHVISISQMQVASLLANAFFCTFPRRNSTKKSSEYAAYPDINFNRLFQCGDSDVIAEKLKCVMTYFRRVCTSAPQGVLTFSRRYIQPGSLPIWGKSKKLLPKIYISSKGYIEDEGCGMLQVDFANKFVGGGVLGWGCVQEEIRFLICPELFVSRLFTECLDSTEALLIVGCERFSSYEGYGGSFKWTGEYHDKTPMDQSGRRYCSIVAMDALHFNNPSNQYTTSNLTREINKAFVGFYEPEQLDGVPLSAVATGNWGCGAFRGDAHLKALLQLMAGAEAGRALAYFTFGDHNLRDHIFRMYKFLQENGVTVGHLWNLLCQYSRQMSSSQGVKPDLYKFLYSAVLEPVLPKEEPQSSIKNFLVKKPSKVSSKECSRISCSTSEAKSSVSFSKGLSVEDIETAIEEVDSETEVDQKQDFPRSLHNQIETRLEKQKVSETCNRQEREDRGRQECKGMQPHGSASKSMSCLSLIEESLGSYSSMKKVENNQRLKLSDTSSNNTHKTSSLFSSCDVSSLPSHQCDDSNSPSPISSNNKPEVKTSNSAVACAKANSEVATDDVKSDSIASTSNVKTDFKDPVGKPASTPRASGTKRKISDYFSFESS